MRKVELLSPAGDLERLKVTLLYGADAVFIGGKKYSLRANATNFSLDEIREGCEFAHKLGKKVHLTLNIVFHNEDIDGVYEYIDDVCDAGIDAFIVSDPFIISYIKSIKEIKEISEKVDIDLEVFIHGAMCTCYSGRCALSNYVTNRDANRGGCSQVCRFSFNTDKNLEFTMATKDLNMARLIPNLIESGARSFKVEGRMRSLYYLATVIGTYRKLIDSYYDGTLTDEKMENYEKTLSRVANRDVSTHYYLKEADKNDQYYTGRVEVSNQDYLGQVLEYDKNKHLVKILERNYFEVGDTVLLFSPNGDEVEFKVTKLYNKDMVEEDVARHPDEVYYLYLDSDISIVKYSMIRKVVE